MSILIETLNFPHPPPGGDIYLHKTSLLFESNPNPSWGWSNREQKRKQKNNFPPPTSLISMDLWQMHKRSSQWRSWSRWHVGWGWGGRGDDRLQVWSRTPPLLTRGRGSAFARVHPYVMCTCRASLTACGTQCVGNRKHQHKGEKRSG